jgi:carbon monoxide dehydrogenase subunit G
MAEVKLEREMAAPAAQVWELLSDFGGIDRWLPGAAKPAVEGEGVGAVRIVKLGGAEIHERLESLDPEARRFQYSIVKAPMPVQNYLATISVEELDAGRSRVHWVTTFDAVGVPEEAIAKGIEGAYRNALDGAAKTFGG